MNFSMCVLNGLEYSHPGIEHLLVFFLRTRWLSLRDRYITRLNHALLINTNVVTSGDVRLGHSDA